MEDRALSCDKQAVNDSGKPRHPLQLLQGIVYVVSRDDGMVCEHHQ